MGSCSGPITSFSCDSALHWAPASSENGGVTLCSLVQDSKKKKKPSWGFELRKLV